MPYPITAKPTFENRSTLGLFNNFPSNRLIIEYSLFTFLFCIDNFSHTLTNNWTIRSVWASTVALLLLFLISDLISEFDQDIEQLGYGDCGCILNTSEEGYLTEICYVFVIHSRDYKSYTTTFRSG